MFKARPLQDLSFPERLNFLLTNRLPRRWLTLMTGRVSKIRSPVFAKLAIRVWQSFVDDLRLHEARESSFESLHACFTRKLKDGARPVAAGADVVSPCDAVVGALGEVRGGEVIQAKGFPYTLADLLGSAADAEAFHNGSFVTLRLKSSMYHRFHAPVDGRLSRIRYISGDTWNVNPVALKVIERLYVKNERVVMRVEREHGDPVTLVAVAAILVASVRLHGVPDALNLRYAGPAEFAVQRSYRKGDEMGYFEHGSTIVMLLPRRSCFETGVEPGRVVRMGEALLRTL